MNLFSLNAQSCTLWMMQQNIPASLSSSWKQERLKLKEERRPIRSLEIELLPQRQLWASLCLLQPFFIKINDLAFYAVPLKSNHSFYIYLLPPQNLIFTPNRPPNLNPEHLNLTVIWLFDNALIRSKDYFAPEPTSVRDVFIQQK